MILSADQIRAWTEQLGPTHPLWREARLQGDALTNALADTALHLYDENERLREAADRLLHFLTYDQDPRNYSADFLGAIQALADASVTEEEFPPS